MSNVSVVEQETYVDLTEGSVSDHEQASNVSVTVVLSAAVAQTAVRAVELKRIISDSKKELEAIEKDLKGRFAEGGVDVLYRRVGRGKTQRLEGVASLVSTGQNRFDQRAFGAKHPRLLKAFTRWYPFDQINYEKGA